MKSTGFIITLACLEECEELARLINSAYRGKSSYAGWTTEAEYLDGQRIDAGMLEEMVRTPQTYLLTLRETAAGPILGCVHLHLASPTDCYLGMLTICPNLQAKGMGKILLAESENFAREKGAKKMTMNVIQLRKSLMEWYERRGYRNTGVMNPFPYGNDRVGIPLRKDLKFIIFEKNISLSN